MDKTLIEKTNLLFLYIGIFCFLFLWDIKGELFEFRYLIVLPFLTTILVNYRSNPLKIINEITIPILIFLHLFILSSYYDFSLMKRDYFGLLYLFIIFIIVTKNKNIIYSNFHNILNYFIILFTLSYIFFFIYSNSDIVLSCYNGWFFRTKYIFLENSHFAIISVPLINYYSLYFSELKSLSKNNFILLIFSIVFLLISYSNFSTTFLVGMALSQLMIIFKNYFNAKLFFFSIYIITVCVVTLFSYDQCSERSFGAIEPIKEFYIFKNTQDLTENEIININQNKEFNENFSKFKLQDINMSMSVETFLVSLEITRKSFFEKPFGVGFNKYYLSHSEYINKIILSDPDIKKNNIKDGSTNISKLITEFGVFGIFLILLLPIFYFRNKKIDNLDFFLLSIISMQFLRGVGYFNGGFIFAYILLIYKLIYLDNLNFRFLKLWHNSK